MTDLRWGFLGASRIGRSTLAPAVHAATGHALHAVAARDRARATTFAHDLGVPRAYGSYEELLADPDVDAVYNALPNDAHLPFTLAALHAGKHVLCEKPLALNAHEVRMIQQAASETGRQVLEAFSYRFHPQIDRAHALLRAGAIGELRFARAAFGFTLTRPHDFRWIAEKGGGALYDVGCYCVSALRLLSGLEARRVSALQRDVNGVDADFAALLDFGDVSAHFDCSFTTARNQHLTFAGTEGTLSLPLPFSSNDQPVTLHLGDDTETFEAMNPYTAMIEHFGRAMRGEEDLRFTLHDALNQARTMDALLTSAREGRTVEVETMEAEGHRRPTV